MNQDAITLTLDQWQKRLTVISTNLNALSESEHTRRICIKSRRGEYTGTTRTQAEQSVALLTHLLDDYLLLADIIKQAEQANQGGLFSLRETAIHNVTRLLEGPSIIGSTSTIALQHRDLLDAPTEQQRLTPLQLLTRMQDQFEQVRDTFNSLAGLEQQVVLTSNQLRQDLATLSSRARLLEGDEAIELVAATDALNQIRDSPGDPLGSAARITTMRRTMEAWSKQLGQLDQVHQDSNPNKQRMVSMTEACSYCRGKVQDGVCEECGKPVKKRTLVSASTGGLDATTAFASAGNTGPGVRVSPATDAKLLAPFATTNSTAPTRSSHHFTINYPTRAGSSNITAPSAKTGSSTSRRRRPDVTSHTSTRRATLGGGLVSLPDLPSQDPLELLLSNPEVPAHKRRCPKCDGQVNRSKGFCPACGTAYNFEPHLKAGDVIAGKYEIKGAIAFGGLGWIYLGHDQVLQRWVILKGLLNSNDAASAAAALAERRYLAAVKHPKIVAIYDFINQDTEGFIIMEYVGGKTIHSMRKQRGPLPVVEAIAYILGILPAFAYLHEQGLVYCDFKPDNLMLEGGDVKLVDMGAVRKIGDPNGDIYATVGYAAPEADNDPVAVSDLYSIGRTLAVLIMDFKFSNEYETTLPSPDDYPVLAENESLTRFLLRATHPDPDERFQSADDMASQLLGVLREIVALQSGPKPMDSQVFTSDRLNTLNASANASTNVTSMITAPAPLGLPTVRVELTDKAASEVIRILSLMDIRQQFRELLELTKKYTTRAAEPHLRLAELVIHHPELSAELAQENQKNSQRNRPEPNAPISIEGLLSANELRDPFDWRSNWYRGIWLLTQKKGEQALVQFEHCYFAMPGELAPRLAMGMAAELAGKPLQALSYYERVGKVDPGFISAHMGAARCHARADQLSDAIAALERVPANHVMHMQSQLAIAELPLAYPDAISCAVLQKAEFAIRSTLPGGGAAYQIAARLCTLAINCVDTIGWPAHSPFLESRFNEPQLRLCAEKLFRQVARQASNETERWYWVEQANRVRPTTLF